ncbi:MAG: DUF1292 domain-containing protein [Thermanaeromonas sp.]|uniref:DUF1292 domain-containing protein n=1 Tax=Thermanaeromonas sp. TaxID=2003697 RepID=UPI00243CF5F6|nr:DUF1292 domain-containing protein [Thermanaeromonas sp.]MCG0277734.1 DUF1292 domain-containing protein [Thermanaeromonas sp.]
MADQETTILLEDEEGQEHEFLVVDILELDGEQYVILLPVEEMGDEALVLKVGWDEEGKEVLYEIESEEEWERVAEAWRKLQEGENIWEDI